MTTRLAKIGLVFYIMLLLWFTLVFVDIPGLLVQGALSSLEVVLESVLIIILMAYLLKWKYSDFFAGFVVVVWAYFQYDSHWQDFLFGASEERLERYYGFFAGTYRFFPQSSTRVVPDAYHIVLGILIAVNLVLIAIKIVGFFKSRRDAGV